MGQESLSSARFPGVEELEISDRAEWLEWRKHNINASEAACLWGDGIHPFTSAYRLWALKSGKIAESQDNEAMKRGRLLEPVAIELMAIEHPAWTIWRPGVYLRHSEWRIGATPDAYMRTYAQGSEVVANLQIKTVGRYAFEKPIDKGGWRDPDTKEVVPPLWVAVQATIETILTGLEATYVAAMVISDGGLLDLHLIPVPIKPGILTNLVQRTKDFWRRVEADNPYPVDHFRDAETLLEVYREDDGSQIDLNGDPKVGEWLTKHGALTQAIRAGEKAQKDRRMVNAKLIERMGNARYGRFGNFTINAANIKRSSYTVAASSHRFVRISEVGK